MKKVVVLSGGSGNTALLEGLYKNKDYNVNIIVNAEDHGKSTGICSEVTNTMGVSDIRKNHYKVFKNSPKYKDIDKDYADAIHDLFEGRHDIDPSNVEDLIAIREKLKAVGFGWAFDYVDAFFERREVHNYEFKNFNIMNIVYSQMYTEYGYEETHKKICSCLGIEDSVVLNSFDRIKLIAQTESGHLLEDEGDIVEWCNPNDKIKNTYHIGHHFGLNERAINLIKDADVIIISSGTFWSSIYPTLQYLDFYEYVNESTANKIWIMNTEEDKDAYGVTSQDFILKMVELGLDLSEFTILENINAVDSLKMPCVLNEDIIETELGNNNGKHDPKLLARAIDYIIENE